MNELSDANVCSCNNSRRPPLQHSKPSSTSNAPFHLTAPQGHTDTLLSRNHIEGSCPPYDPAKQHNRDRFKLESKETVHQELKGTSSHPRVFRQVHLGAGLIPKIMCEDKEFYHPWINLPTMCDLDDAFQYIFLISKEQGLHRLPEDARKVCTLFFREYTSRLHSDMYAFDDEYRMRGVIVRDQRAHYLRMVWQLRMHLGHEIMVTPTGLRDIIEKVSEDFQNLLAVVQCSVPYAANAAINVPFVYLQIQFLDFLDGSCCFNCKMDGHGYCDSERCYYNEATATVFAVSHHLPCSIQTVLIISLGSITLTIGIDRFEGDVYLGFWR